MKLAAHTQLPILSLFSGIGMLDSGFTGEGFCVVSGPEKILGGDVREFRAVPGVFQGVIGGPPCQDFSHARRSPPTGEGLELLGHFRRLITEADPAWFLMENVPSVPDLVVDGYHVQRFDLCPTMLGYPQRRRRHFQFGSKAGLLLTVKRRPFTGTKKRCVMASEGITVNRRTWADFCELQGLPGDFDLPQMHKAGKYRAVGNGVHLAVAAEVARAIAEVLSAEEPRTIHNSRTCACGCGRLPAGRKRSATPACRKRLQKKRDVAAEGEGMLTTPMPPTYRKREMAGAVNDRGSTNEKKYQLELL